MTTCGVSVKPKRRILKPKRRIPKRDRKKKSRVKQTLALSEAEGRYMPDGWL